jgi:DNA repair protein RadC
MKKTNYTIKIKDLKIEERPREKLIYRGLENLNTNELLAIILSTGTRKEEVMSMASRLIKDYGEKSLIKQTNPQILAKEFSLPINKACQLIACLEIGRRLFIKSQADKPIIRSSEDAFNYLSDMGKLSKEQLRGLYLNTNYQLIQDELISLGTLNANLVSPREIFKTAIYYNSAAIIIAHNHPSGQIKASLSDLKATKEIKKAGEILGIQLLDHLIIADNKFISII